jgi:putative transposase
MIGVRADGTKELVALADGFRESTESWADLLRSCRQRGMTAPVLAVGDGALGFWKAVREVFPDTREQRCWFHVSSNVLAALPKSAHPMAKAALAEIYNAEDRDHAITAVKAFAAELRRQVAQGSCQDHPARGRAPGVLRLPGPALDPPAYHQSSRPSPPSGCVSGSPRDPARAPPESRWRSSSSSPHKPAGVPSTRHLVALVRAGARFEKRKLVERPDESGGDQQVAGHADPQVLTIPPTTPTNSVRCSRKHHILPTSTRRWNRCGAIRRRRPQRCSTRSAGIFPTATSPRPPAKPRPSTAAGWQTRI